MESVETLVNDAVSRVSTPRTDYTVVLGAPRSGTTFLMRLLNTFPHFECISGTLLSTSIPQIVCHPLSQEIFDALAIGFEQSLDAYLHSGRFLSRASALQKWMNAPDGISGLIRSLKGHRKVNRIVYKEPFLSFSPEFVDAALPEAQIIYIYRDGRDVAHSLVRTYDVLTDEKLTSLHASEMRLGRRYDSRYVPWWVDEGMEERFMNSSPFVRAIWMWTQMNRRCREYYSRPELVSTGRVLFIRYEDLVRRPQEIGALLLSWLGEKSNRRFEKMLSKAHVRSIGLHKQRNHSEIQKADHVAQDELTAFGYL